MPDSSQNPAALTLAKTLFEAAQELDQINTNLAGLIAVREPIDVGLTEMATILTHFEFVSKGLGTVLRGTLRLVVELNGYSFQQFGHSMLNQLEAVSGSFYEYKANLRLLVQVDPDLNDTRLSNLLQDFDETLDKLYTALAYNKRVRVVKFSQS